ncbi:MAG: ATP-binding cassette domain-containing protein [Christensenellaceae bacterium]|nr:ATP-binding cassette domain-containing protein [Christensenellaceae bacterium]
MSITLEHVGKSFGDKTVLSDISLTLPDGGSVCFFGPSGCGKTTLLRLICGLEKADGGTIAVPKGTRFSVHFQEDRLLPWHTVAENLALTMPAGEVGGWLRAIGLPDIGNQYPDELSGGMRRRVSLARALGHDSDVLVLDEPLRELDAAMAETMLELIRARKGNRLLLLVTHDRLQAEALGCEIVDMQMEA